MPEPAMKAGRLSRRAAKVLRAHQSHHNEFLARVVANDGRHNEIE